MVYSAYRTLNVTQTTLKLLRLHSDYVREPCLDTPNQPQPRKGQKTNLRIHRKYVFAIIIQAGTIPYTTIWFSSIFRVVSLERMCYIIYSSTVHAASSGNISITDTAAL